MNTAQAISELQKFLSFKRASEYAEDVLTKLQDAEAETKEQETKRDKLKEEVAKLSAEVGKAKTKISQADEKALGIIQTAEAKAHSILSAVDDAVKDAQAKADKKLKETLDRIEASEGVEKYALEAAKAAQSKLDAINAELDKSTAKFKALVA